MEETLKAYLAGCIDCDGSIGIKRSTYGMRVLHTSGCSVYSERVLFAQVKPDITLLLKEHFGGNYGIDKQRSPGGHPIYRWCATDKNAVRCVTELLPYLTIKRRQAELLLELRKLKEEPRVRDGTFKMTNRWGVVVEMPRRIVSPDVLRQKEGLFNEIKSLNDIRPQQPQLVGSGLSGEEKGRCRKR